MYLSFLLFTCPVLSICLFFFYYFNFPFFFINYKRTEGVKISLRKFKCAQFQVFCCSCCTVCIRCCCWVCNPLWRGGTPSSCQRQTWSDFSQLCSFDFAHCCSCKQWANGLALSLALSLGHRWGMGTPGGQSSLPVPWGHRGSQLCFLWATPSELTSLTRTNV